jgi:protein-disulfide isomerase
VTGTPTLFVDDKAVEVTGLTPNGLATMIAEAAQK